MDCPACPSKNLHLRPVESIDRTRLWFWANDCTARANSFDPRPISWSDHCHWFESHLADPLWKAWIGIDSAAHPIGIVRFQVHGTHAAIGVNIINKARGQGFGRALIKQGCAALFDVFPISVVDALIKPNNHASRAVFQSAGFREINASSIPFLHRHLILENPRNA